VLEFFFMLKRKSKSLRWGLT